MNKFHEIAPDVPSACIRTYAPYNYTINTPGRLTQNKKIKVSLNYVLCCVMWLKSSKNCVQFCNINYILLHVLSDRMWPSAFLIPHPTATNAFQIVSIVQSRYIATKSTIIFTCNVYSYIYKETKANISRANGAAFV